MLASPAANSDSFQVTTPSDAEVQMTRLFNAPPELVFEVMSTPEHVRQWWGNLGEGYSVPVCEIDFRVGGKWRFVNKHPQGEVEFYGTYLEIDAPHRIVFTEIFAPYPDNPSTVTTVLAEENGKTRMTATVDYGSKEVRDMVIASGMARGAGLSYDRLEDLLGRLRNAPR